ncbi:unnamed protein product [Cylindrotheca closterium]|uniref:Uncharacterized protein n=1 Tax=Cylindrotheca closterium TaxID=2856 RepID=A0AAD2FZ80_9STRA|nr:unnamed protein product [Cylindrotheca closterium]
MSPPNKKKTKIDLEALCSEVWEHFRQYLDSVEENGGEGDVDELQEIIELSEVHVKYSDSPWTSVVDLLPVLLSVAYNTLADLAIGEYLSTRDDMQSEQRDPKNDGAKQVQSLLIKSLDFFPENAATWSMGANFGRMTNQLSPSNCRQWYQCAVENASRLRSKALEILNDEDVEDLLLKEWIELLILNQVVGVEFEPTQEESEEEEEDLEADDKKSEDEKEEDDDQDKEGEYSASTVESTARFMCAMLWSMVDHQTALMHLKKLPVTHRLHPNVWTLQTKAPDRRVSKAPLAFRPQDGVLPQKLYASIKDTFSPDAEYWNESDYSNRGYYSYFVEYKKNIAPRNLIEDVIVNYLLPRAKQVLCKTDAESICGFEWWVHTRSIKANLGHNLHFDTDESMLQQEKKVTHPILSSVLYLTGGDDDNKGGTTIILNQTPDSKEVADSAWLSAPKDNSFLLFPGNLLHGVLPCPGRGQPDDKEEGNTPQSQKDLIRSWRNPQKGETANRLTFMVGFWTRNVPKSMKQRRLYGPCGPLPPATGDHSWVQNITKGYDKSSPVESGGTDSAILGSPLVQVSPAWEVIDGQKEETPSEELQLEIPHTIDHRFFVRNAPECFRDSLFEDNDDD